MYQVMHRDKRVTSRPLTIMSTPGDHPEQLSSRSDREPLLPGRSNISDDGLESVVTARSGRMLDRDSLFRQSRGHWSVQRVRGNERHRSNRPGERWRQFWNSWFHSLGHKPTILLIAILFLVYTALIFLYALIYWVVSTRGTKQEGTTFCHMDIEDFMEGLYFSLSTMTAIGYGVSDYYFGECWTPLIIVLSQVFAAITFDAVAIGIIFQRISRGQKRGKTIVFSDKAVVRRVRGVPHLMCRIGELRRDHLIEATVRAYCIRHVRMPVEQVFEDPDGNVRRSTVIETSHFLTQHMELLQPSAESGSHLLLSLPQVVVHRMDESSPLVPPKHKWYDADGTAHTITDPPSNNLSGTTDEVCRRAKQDSEDIQKFLYDREAEIVILLEGTDELTGASLQARHSYTLDELAWDCAFAPCVYPGSLQGRSRRSWLGRRRRLSGDHACTVDFTHFHDVVPTALDCSQCPDLPATD